MDMHGLARMVAASAVALACLAGATARAAQPVGEIERVGIYAYGTPPGAGRAAVYQNDDVYFGERLETVEKGSLKVRFVDDSELYLGAKADLVIEDFVYDPRGNRQSSAIRMALGAFRMVSGKMPKEAVKLTTPSAVIGIRGTDLSVGVAADGGTVVAVNHGVVSVTASQSGQQISLSAGQVASVSADGTTVTSVSASQAPSDPGIDSAAGGIGTGATGAGGGDGAGGGGGGGDGGGGGH